MEKTQVAINIGLELHIQLLGKFSVSVRKNTLPEECWRSRRARSLVKLLALTHDHRLHRDQIIEVLWANSNPAAATNNFYQTLYTARRVLESYGASVLVLEEGFLSLARADGQTLTVDVEQFETAAALAKGSLDPQAYQDALALYSGDLLPDDLYEEWTIPRREALRMAFLYLMLDLAELHETRQEYPQGIAALQQLLSVEKSYEEAHAGLMRLYAISGQRQQAVRQYQTLCDVLSQELEAEPSQSTLRLYEAIQKGDFTPSLPKTQSVHNLPVQVTSFIGREKEIETLKQVLLSGKTRLVTVTGAGGTGKTRLALRAAEELLDAYPQGIWLVELAAVADPGLLPYTVASALNLRENPNKPILETLVDFLRARRALIILDTCEHLVDAVASLVDCFLHAAPRVAIMTTSREILGVIGEMPLLCPSLGLPAPHLLKIRTEVEQLEALVSSEAVRLFAERSAFNSPGFSITEKNALIVAQICRQLDGIPLAIELAAARMRILSLEQIAERLDNTFVLLTGGSRTALPRQQTLKATIDWSYNLLTSAERALLLRLSIFTGGWTLEAAEAVCTGDSAGSENILTEEILDLLGRLVDKSLILVELGFQSEPRYRMLDTIRQYAHDRMLEGGGLSVVQERHLAYYLKLAERAQPYFRSRDAMEWLDRLEVELPNLRLALEWSLTGQVESGLHLASTLMLFWHIRSRRFEGIHWLERLLEADIARQSNSLRPPSPCLARGTALTSAAFLNHFYPGDYQEHAKTQAKEGLAIIRNSGDQGMPYLPCALYIAATTEEEIKECLDVARRVGDELYFSECMWILGRNAYYRGDFEQATTYLAENLEIHKKMGDVEGEGWGYYLQSELAYLQGQPDLARELCIASQHCLKAVGNLEFALYVSGFLAKLAITQGNYLQALEIGEAQMVSGQDITSTVVTADALGNIGWAVWAMQEDSQFARRCAETLGSDWENYLPCGRGTLFYVFGRTALTRGDYTQAQTYLSHFKSLAIPENYLSIQALGILAALTGQAHRAAVIFGALDRCCGWLHNVMSPAEQGEYQRSLALTRTALGEEPFAAAWAEGQGFTLKQMRAFASTVK